MQFTPQTPWLVAVFSLIFVGCTPTPEPTVSAAPLTPTPEPTFACTPLFGGDPTTCTQEESDELDAKRAQYDEADALYRAATAEMEDLIATKEPMTASLEGKLAGTFLDETRQVLLDFQADDVEVSGHAVVEWSVPKESPFEGSNLVMRMCVTSDSINVVVNGVQ
ncbi:MAG: hypothetical protein ACK5MT_21555, partial [Actinomycetales bacterium]